ncbi:glycosyltransferase family 2 protein [Nocardioides alkalitolerans]|uniref:glycosyltransferase family 2 protein n=1 Tax=Nocardioides alkalitolerans TaxID=281714 RepID=UPI000412F4B6|nr:galactosyltransferase-related protein [Nocardioides alkalitolerans]
MSTAAATAVVTLARGRHEHLAAQHLSVCHGTRRPDDYVLASMDDPSLVEATTGGLRRRVVPVAASAAAGLPLAAARNLAIGTAFDAGAEVVVGLDADCLAGRRLVAAYADVVARRPGTIWSGPVTYLDPRPAGGYPLGDLELLDDPHPARPAPAPGVEEDGADPRLFWSLSFALSREAWERSGGFCEDYVGYGAEDTDFARRADRAGLDFGWVGSARAYHQHHPVSRPPVEHLDAILRNAGVFHGYWGEWPMLGWLEEFERRGLAVRDADGRWRRA